MTAYQDVPESARLLHAGARDAARRMALRWSKFIVGLALAAATAVWWSFATAAPADDVLARYAAIKRAVSRADAGAFLSQLTPECRRSFEDQIVWALHASEEETRALRPCDFCRVINLRARLTAAELKALTPESLIAWYLDSGQWSREIDKGTVPLPPTISGDSATVMLGMRIHDGRPFLQRLKGGFTSNVVPIQNTRYEFVKLNGDWLLDLRAQDEAMDRSWERQAAAANRSLQEVMNSWLEQAIGPPKVDVLRPLEPR